MPPLSHQLFLLFSSFVEERTGLSYAPGDRVLFSDKLSSRLVDAGFENALDYYYFLRYDPAGEAELAALVEVLVVGETYLFRERDVLTAAVDQIIKPAIEARGRVRVWSAGCSTGEEPFSLAMLLADQNLLEQVELTATDLSGRALASARRGDLMPRSLRLFTATTTTPVPDWARRLVDRWVTLDARGGGRLSSALVSRIDFRRDNLLSPAAHLDSLRDLDLILCRNVLIYFRDDNVRKIVSMFTDRLRPSGRLVVGASESLLRFGTALRCEERGGAFFYVKDPA